MKRIDMNHFLAAQNRLVNRDLGNFNIFWVHELDACALQPIPYNRRDFYKINLLNMLRMDYKRDWKPFMW